MPAPRHIVDPFQQIRRELDQVFDRFMGEGFMPMPAPRREAAAISPQLDACMEGDTLLVEVDLPGVAPDNVECTFHDGTLTIKGERRKTSGDGGLVRERRFGRFERRITLPEGIDEDRLDARFENGVLTITAQLKPGLGQQRRIQIAGAPERKEAVGKQRAQQVQVQPEPKQAKPDQQGDVGQGQPAEPQRGSEQQKS